MTEVMSKISGHKLYIINEKYRHSQTEGIVGRNVPLLTILTSQSLQPVNITLYGQDVIKLRTLNYPAGSKSHPRYPYKKDTEGTQKKRQTLAGCGHKSRNTPTTRRWKRKK